MTNEKEMNGERRKGLARRLMANDTCLGILSVIAVPVMTVSAMGLGFHYSSSVETNRLNDGSLVRITSSPSAGVERITVEKPNVLYVDENGDRKPDYVLVGRKRMNLTPEDKEYFHETLDKLSAEEE